jgi:aminoglycoside phosphotransferase family enzyme
MTINIAKSFYKRIAILLRNSEKVDNKYDYFRKISLGNKRFISIFSKLNNNEWDIIFKNMWIDLDLFTRDIAGVLEGRLEKGFVKILHGDISWTNTYYANGNFFLLDPCVAAKDMYYIDMLYQFADVLVEFIKYGYTEYIDQLVNLYKSEFSDKVLVDLKRYYIKRHALIRASVRYLGNDKSYKDYLKVWRQDGKYI